MSLRARVTELGLGSPLVFASVFAFAALSACSSEPAAPIDSADAGSNGGGEDGGGSGGTDGGGTTGAGGLCPLVQQVMPKCLACHHQNGSFPNLEYDFIRTSLVNVASEGYPGNTLVVPGDSANSFFYRKVAGPLSAEEGEKMPTGTELSAADVAVVKAWIDDGASLDCDLPAGYYPPGLVKYHPEGYREPATHGSDLRLGVTDCRKCHGDTLTGGAGSSCDTCHQDDWRTNCTYCHGGTDDTTGAPPRDLDGQTVTEMLRFRAHTPHTTESNHAAYDCDQCHVKPTDVMSASHVFDDTPGSVEVVFTAGLSPTGDFQGAGTCASLYCHGNGRTTGSWDHTRGQPTCSQCHAGPGSTSTAYGMMSGQHRRHLTRNMTCNDCHSSTVDATGTITAPANHVNGTKEVAFSVSGFTRSAAGTCTGSCHNERHSSERW